MDGNRRWAKAENLSTLEGHRTGLTKLKEVAGWARESGVDTLVLYAFSSENWNRASEEVDYLMELAVKALDTELAELRAQDMRIRFIGDLSRLPEAVRTRVQKCEQESRDGKNGTLVFALSYGGRAEIVAAANKLLAEGKKEVDEASFASALWSSGVSDPDIIIRTGGEHRLSNFLSWQSAYSELFFINTYWPDFSKEEFEKILNEFATRERRHGK